MKIYTETENHEFPWPKPSFRHGVDTWPWTLGSMYCWLHHDNGKWSISDLDGPTKKPITASEAGDILSAMALLQETAVKVMGR